MSRLPSTVKVISTAQRVRYRMPRPAWGVLAVRMPVGLVFCILGVGTAGLFIGFAILELSVDGLEFPDSLLLLLMLFPVGLGLFFARIGLSLMDGREEVEITPQSLRRLTRAGPFCGTSERSRAGFRRFLVVKPQSHNGDYELQAEYEMQKPLVLASGTQELLASLADDMAERIGGMRPISSPLQSDQRVPGAERDEDDEHDDYVDWMPEQTFADGRDDRDGADGNRQSLGAPVTLCPDRSPKREFLRMFLFTLFWYGFLAFFGRGVISGFVVGRPDWNVALQLLIPVLVGLFPLCQAGYSFLKLCSPQPTVTLSKAPLFLGDTVELSWHFSRNTGSMRSLEIYLCGEEWTETQCGNSRKRRSVTETFAELPVIESQVAIPSGKAQMTVPENTMHSFEPYHCGIVWSLQVFADVRFWRDVAVSFPIVVLPQQINTDSRPDERAEN
jgi:hypothetical protein